jgi:hypothetical protein
MILKTVGYDKSSQYYQRDYRETDKEIVPELLSYGGFSLLDSACADPVIVKYSRFEWKEPHPLYGYDQASEYWILGIKEYDEELVNRYIPNYFHHYLLPYACVTSLYLLTCNPKILGEIKKYLTRKLKENGMTPLERKQFEKIDKVLHPEKIAKLQAKSSHLLDKDLDELHLSFQGNWCNLKECSRQNHELKKIRDIAIDQDRKNLKKLAKDKNIEDLVDKHPLSYVEMGKWD